MTQKRSVENIIEEIKELQVRGEDLSYSNMDHHHVALFRSAIRHFGSWRAAIEAAGMGYESIRRYKSWSQDRIVDRIRELHAQGVDLSWRHISTAVDPQLAAAATRLSSYGSWRNAVEAAGLDYDAIRRYKDWDEARILGELRERSQAGEPLNAGEVCLSDTALITAARRTFGSWDKALEAAGIDSTQVRKRAPGQRRGRDASQEA